MKVTLVNIKPPVATQSNASLSPELMAACMARYSRSPDGVDKILAAATATEEKEELLVSRIFNLIDYGHVSVSDMAPASLFLDEVSIFLAYLVFSLCPLAGGQEVSTRYCKMKREGVVAPHLYGVMGPEVAAWEGHIDQCFADYQTALDFWAEVLRLNPKVLNLPDGDYDQKVLDRLARNYAFDRSRYFLPITATTGLALVQSAREWMKLTNALCSHWLPEARVLGDKIVEALTPVFPHLMKHFGYSEVWEARQEADRVYALDYQNDSGAVVDLYEFGEDDAPCVAEVAAHTNRYNPFSKILSLRPVTFGWTKVSFAEIRDLNRHRTGSKWCPLVPQGFYCANEQLTVDEVTTYPDNLAYTGATMRGRNNVAVEDRTTLQHLAYGQLGVEFPFFHTTTLDKAIYEIELRTGTGAHFRYKKHMEDLVAEITKIDPALGKAIHCGQGEPE